MMPVFLLLNRMANRRRALLLSKTPRPMKAYKEASRKEFCRTCLSTKNLECIFSEVECEEKRSEDLQLVTGLKITLNDGLSQKICTRCIKTIDSALRFRRVSKKTEKVLLNMTVKNKKIPKAGKCVPETKHVITKTESENGDIDNDYGDVAFDDGYENYDCPDLYNSYQEEEEPRDEEKPLERGRRKSRIPNASSYKCNTCNKEFRMKTTYTAHMRFHTNYCVCEVCGKRCRNNNQLQEHKRARHGMGRIHKCAYCEYSSATKEALVIHERRHTGERPYVCDHCGATFHRRSNLVQHIAIHLPEKNFQCDMCPKRLKSKKFLQIHKHNAHTGKRYGYLCSVCDHRFEKPNKVRAHTRRVHGLPDEQQGPIVNINDTLPQKMCSTCINFVNESIRFRRKCEESNKILRENKHSVIKDETCFKSEDNSISIDISDSFEDDFKDYDDNITLDTLQCNNTSESIKENSTKKLKNSIKLSKPESVANNTKLKRNGKIAGNKKEKTIREKIECEYCHKILTSRLSLRNHYKIHTGFDVVCEHCGKKFITRRLLLMHCRAKHGYEKTDKCSFCEYRASNAEQVKIHERLHTGEKPFVCKECNAGFHRKSSYLQHVAIHLPEKTVQCDQCPARFKSVTLMNIHKNRHRPSPYSFVCGVCDNSFVRRRNVVRHLMRVHGVEGESHVRRVRVT